MALVSHIAFVQTRGQTDTDAGDEKVVASRGFTNLDNALIWLSAEVESAHGGNAEVCESSFKTADKPWAVRCWTVRTEDGPTWGMVVEV